MFASGMSVSKRYESVSNRNIDAYKEDSQGNTERYSSFSCCECEYCCMEARVESIVIAEVLPESKILLDVR